MKLALIKNDGMEDWFLIEKAKHDGRTWLAPFEGGGMMLMSSARISDADIEGTAEEMLGIANAIVARGEYSAKRCSVSIDGDRALFDSPRNSMRAGVVTLAEADALAIEIKEAIAS